MKRPWVRIEQRREQLRAVLAAGPLNQAQIAQALGVKPTSADKFLRTLVADGFLTLAQPKAVSGYGPWPARYALADDRQSRYAQDRVG